ncbi:MAG TPA: prepilin-type N-terminal cleavage/methylation domain-containing protein [Candidatus Omnitrophota bacterium]|nr:prepilin-type N-terminal cleavage/methylation domain-containing protein [Candidatus Omnitrophota bacterium]
MKMLTKKGGFTLVEIMIVVAIIGLLAAIAIPNFMRARETAQKNACIANLKQIDGAITLWALDEGMGSTDAVTMADLVGDYIKTTPYCPLDTDQTGYTVATVADPPACPRVADYPEHTLPTTAAEEEEEEEEVPVG